MKNLEVFQLNCYSVSVFQLYLNLNSSCISMGYIQVYAYRIIINDLILKDSVLRFEARVSSETPFAEKYVVFLPL